MGYCLTKAKLSQGFSVAKRYCLSPKIRCEETIPVDEKKGVWLEDVIENLRPVVTLL